MNPFDKIANGTLPIDLTNDPKLKELILKSMQKRGNQKEKVTAPKPAVGIEGGNSNANTAEATSNITIQAAHNVDDSEEAIFTLDDIEAIGDEEAESSKPSGIMEGKRQQEEQAYGANKKAKVSLSHLEDDE